MKHALLYLAAATSASCAIAPEDSSSGSAGPIGGKADGESVDVRADDIREYCSYRPPGGFGISDGTSLNAVRDVLCDASRLMPNGTYAGKDAANEPCSLTVEMQTSWFKGDPETYGVTLTMRGTDRPASGGQATPYEGTWFSGGTRYRDEHGLGVENVFDPGYGQPLPEVIAYARRPVAGSDIPLPTSLLELGVTAAESYGGASYWQWLSVDRRTLAERAAQYAQSVFCTMYGADIPICRTWRDDGDRPFIAFYSLRKSSPIVPAADYALPLFKCYVEDLPPPGDAFPFVP